MIVCITEGHVIKLQTYDDDDVFVMGHLHQNLVLQSVIISAAQKEMQSESISAMVAIVHMPEDTPWSLLLEVAPQIRKREYKGPFLVAYVVP